jgi:hypothetical protein
MVGDVCPRRLLTVASGTPRIMSQDAKVCPEVMEVEIRQSCSLTGSIKAMSHVVPSIPGVIVKDPRHIEPGS